jgi:hypothetical protein
VSRCPLALLAALAAFVAVAVPAAPASANPSPYTATDRSLIDEYAAIEGAKLHVTLPGGPENFIELKESPLSTLPTPSGPALGETPCADATGGDVGPVVGCVIELAVTPHKNGELRDTISHEVFHVFQALMSGTLENFLGDPRKDWLIEGSAQWVESELIKNNRSARYEWTSYLRSPGTQLFTRVGRHGYAAVGFFGHMASSHISPWSRFKSMFEAKGSPAAWAAGVGGDTAFLNSEAAAFFREPGLGPEWDASGPNVPTSKEVGFKPTKLNFTKTTPPKTLTVKPYADGAYDLSISGLSVYEPVLEVTVSSGYVRLRSTSGGHVDAVEPKQVLLCSDPKGYSCPSRPSQFQEFQRGDLAITGGPTGGSVKLVRRKPCEVLLPALSCLTLLPGFTQLISSVEGKPTAVETRRPDGTSDSACAFLYKGEEIAGPEGEGPIFKGVTAPVINVLRSSSIGGAITYYKLISIAIPGFQVSHPKIGEEAVLLTRSGTDQRGQVEYGSSAVVRVHNIVVNYALYGTPGNTEADPKSSLALLALVVSKL